MTPAQPPEDTDLITLAPSVSDLTGAVVVGAVPGQSPRVLGSALHAASLLQKPLAVVHVDTTQNVLPDTVEGYADAVRPELDVLGHRDYDAVRRAAESHLADAEVIWRLHRLAGDPALAISQFASIVDAELIVVGTRGHGVGEVIREFVTGPVAARLSHVQTRPLLVIPQDQR